MAIEAIQASQDSDCPNVIVVTKNGVVTNSWGVWPEDDQIELGYEVDAAGMETECTRQPTDEERTAILEALADWKAVGNWDNAVPWMTRELKKSPDGKARALEIARAAAAGYRETGNSPRLKESPTAR